MGGDAGGTAWARRSSSWAVAWAAWWPRTCCAACFPPGTAWSWWTASRGSCSRLPCSGSLPGTGRCRGSPGRWRFERVFAIGDVVGIPLAMGKPLPKAGVFARAQAEVVARNVARAVAGRGRPAAFDGQGFCFIETGDGRAGYGAGNFYAEPVPEVKVRAPGRIWHAGKVLFEADCPRRWF